MKPVSMIVAAVSDRRVHLPSSFLDSVSRPLVLLPLALLALSLAARADRYPDFDDDAKPILRMQPHLLDYVRHTFEVKDTGIARIPGNDDRPPQPPFIFQARPRGSDGAYFITLLIQPGPEGRILKVVDPTRPHGRPPAMAGYPGSGAPMPPQEPSSAPPNGAPMAPFSPSAPAPNDNGAAPSAPAAAAAPATPATPSAPTSDTPSGPTADTPSGPVSSDSSSAPLPPAPAPGLAPPPDNPPSP